MSAGCTAALEQTIAEAERELRLVTETRNFHADEATRLNAVAAEQEVWTKKAPIYQAAVQRRSHAQMLTPRVLVLQDKVRRYKTMLADLKREIDTPVPAPSAWSLNAEQAAAVDDTAGIWA